MLLPANAIVVHKQGCNLNSKGTAFLALLLFAVNASAAIVEYAFSGTLAKSGMADDFDLDGASFEARYRFDTEAVPISTGDSPDRALARFDSISADITIFDRPRSAPAFTSDLASRGLSTVKGDTLNAFDTASGLDDQVGVNTARILEFEQTLGQRLVVGSFNVYFDRTFFPGTDPIPMATDFGGKIATEAGPWSDDSAGLNSGGDYDVVGLSASASVIPIPAAAWLFVSSLGLLGWMQRKSG